MVRSTVTLVNTIKKMQPVITFFKDRYFPDGRVYNSEKALIEIMEKGKKIAPFVVPVVDGIPVVRDGYRTDMIDAPYIIPKGAITARDLEKKAFGESPESGRAPADRENEIEAELLVDLRESTYRRHELMCTEIITTGKVEIKQYASAEDAAAGENFVPAQLTYFGKGGAFGNRYSFSSNFREMSASEKIQEFYKMARVLRKRGVRATDIVMTSDVSMLLFSDEKFLEFYNKRDAKTGDINAVETPEGVVHNGTIKVNGTVFDLFTYDEIFEDLDGKEKEFLPEGTIAFLKPGMGTTVYAQVTFVKGEAFQSFAEKIVPRVVASEKNNTVEVQMYSRPVPYPLDVDGWLVANIYDQAGTGASLDGSRGGLTSSSGEDARVVSHVDDGNPADGGPDLKTESEINAMSTKAPLIAYGESIGLEGLTDASSVAELKSAILSYQEATYGPESLG